MNNRTCNISECERSHNAHGWCLAHYKRWQKYGDPLGSAPKKTSCSVEGCDRPWRAVDWCNMHYQRIKKYGDLNRGHVRNICDVQGCNKFRHSDGYCVKHYTRWKRHWSATARMPGEIVDGKKICPGCKVDKVLTDYTPGSTGRCKPCVAQIKKAKYVPVKADCKPIDCIQCGDEFKPLKSTILLCSKECVELRKKELDSDVRNTRRARMRNARTERVGRMAVFERDKWTCGICGHKISKDLRHPSPLSVSLDHIIPISKGGAHSMNNTQAAHLVCNLRKGARVEL